jgi:hypothetical protein
MILASQLLVLVQLRRDQPEEQRKPILHPPSRAGDTGRHASPALKQGELDRKRLVFSGLAVPSSEVGDRVLNQLQGDARISR